MFPTRIQLSRFKALAYAPQEWARELGWRANGRWRAALAASRACASVDDAWCFAEQHFQPCQKPSEILDFLRWARGEKPRVVVEIGVARGGTSYLLMKGLPSLEHYLGVDFFPRHTRLLRELARPGLKLNYVRGASGDTRVLERVEKLLCGRQIDLLFIDGDHAYAAVKRDWENYRGLVRSGGWIAFHDIRPPEMTPEGGYANGFEVAVHRFWSEVKTLGVTREFVADDKRPGYGIGALQVGGPPSGGRGT